MSPFGGCVPGAWDEELPYSACVNCGRIFDVPPAPKVGAPPRWVLWLGRRFR